MKKFFALALSAAMLLSTTGIVVANRTCAMPVAKSCHALGCSQCQGSCCGVELKIFALHYDTLPSSFTRTACDPLPAILSMPPHVLPAAARRPAPAPAVPLPVPKSTSPPLLQCFLI